MIVNQGETKELTIRNRTIDGIMINIVLTGDTLDTAITIANLLTQNITVKATLKREKSVKVLMQNNLRILGLYSTLNYGQTDWTRGNVMTYDAAGAFETRLLSLFIPLGGFLNIKGTDEFVIEFVVAQGTFGATINSTSSYLEFNPHYAVGYETGIPYIYSSVVQQNITQQEFSLGDNVTKIMLINFDQNGYTDATQVIQTVQLTSDKLDASYNNYDLFNIHRNVFTSPIINRRYAATQPALTDQALPYLPDFPQSYILFAGKNGEVSSLDSTTVYASFNGALVAASQNYVVWSAFETSLKLLERARLRKEKHIYEKLQSLPETL